VVLQVQIKMASVVVTLKIMPISPETDLEDLETKATEQITNFGGEVGKSEQIPVAFGLKSLNLTFVMDEDKGSTEELEKHIQEFEAVNSVEVIDVRRTIG
jgi:elongation factor 1-beta